MGFLNGKPKINDPYGTQGGSGRNKKESESDRKKRLNKEWEAAKTRTKKAHRRQAENEVEKNKNKRFTTYSPAGTKNVPFGTKMKEVTGPHGEKEYRLVVDESQVDGTHPGDLND